MQIDPVALELDVVQLDLAMLLAPGSMASTSEMSGRHPASVKAMAGGHMLGFHRRMSESSAIYEPMLTIGWVGQRPADHQLA
jgi:hypothetical protein